MAVTRRKKQAVRNLEDTSWLAQTISDRRHMEFENNGITGKYNCLDTLHAIVNEADDPENDKIFYDACNCKRQIIIRDIPSLAIKLGMDYCREGMRCRLLGMAESCKDGEGNPLIRIFITHDLNSAIIDDVGELLYAISRR